MSGIYKCPHCGKEINEVREVVMDKREIIVSAGIGIGVALLFFGSFSSWSIWAAVGAGVISAAVVSVMFTFLPKRYIKK